jgi:mRNA-degrading endonuclease RelE of RelBE toxin-antitoxin system
MIFDGGMIMKVFNRSYRHQFFVAKWDKALDKRDEFRIKEKRALESGHKLRAAAYRLGAKVYDHKVELITDIICANLKTVS